MRNSKCFSKYIAIVTLTGSSFMPLYAYSGATNAGFQATIATVEQVIPSQYVPGTICLPGQLVGVTSGIGTMGAGQSNRTYNGPVTISATDCATPGPNLKSLEFDSGRLTITAGNPSDTITATYYGSFISTGNGSNYRINSAAFVITGGTGIFSKASGRGELRGAEVVDEKQQFIGQLSASGVISY